MDQPVNGNLINPINKGVNPILYSYTPAITSMVPMAPIYAVPPYMQTSGGSYGNHSQFDNHYGVNNAPYSNHIHQQNVGMSMPYGDSFYQSQPTAVKYPGNYMQGAPFAYYTMSTLSSFPSFPSFQSEQ